MATTSTEQGLMTNRFQNTRKVFTKFQDKRELENGYALCYPLSDEWNQALDEFTETWRKCCPYFDFELWPEEGSGQVWLRITGPDGTKSFVDCAHKMLTSNLNPAQGIRWRLRLRWGRLTNRLRVVPDFLIIGAKKSGTTSLYAYLTQHPAMSPALMKEIYYFDTKRFGRGIGWYRSFFPTVFERFLRRRMGSGFITGEASPEYILHQEAPQRIDAAIPGVKLIVVLRNPADRAYSYYQHQLRTGFESLSFEAAIDREEAWLRDDPHFFNQQYSYLVGGIYAKHLRAWVERFGHERLLILTNELLAERPEEAFRRAVKYLGLSPHTLGDTRKFNAFPYPDMLPDTRRRLLDFYRPYNVELTSLLGIELNWNR